jgi:hypothetical protein
MKIKIDSDARHTLRQFARLALGAGLGLLAAFVVDPAMAQTSGSPIQGSVIGSPFDSPAPAKSASTNAAVSTAVANGSHDTAGFDKLAGFPFKVSDDMIIGVGDAVANSREIAGQIPESVRALDDKEVSITGFMLPTKVDAGKATEFLLLKNQSMCCYGLTPNLNEYVSVRMAGSGVTPVMDRLITVTGKLHVGEMRQSRLLVGLYQMDGDRVAAQSLP